MKQSTIALYLLVIINIIGLSIIVRDTGNALKPADFGKQVHIVDSKQTYFDGYNYLNLKIINTAKVPMDNVNIDISIYDTNNVHMCTFNENCYTVFHPNEEKIISTNLGYGKTKYPEDKYTFKTSIGYAHRAK